jgi:hypothetical protein
LSFQIIRKVFLNVIPAVFLLCWSAVPTLAQSQKKGDASLRMEYQFIRTGSFRSQGQEFDYWTTDTQVAMLSGDYAINDRWTVFAALPYVGKRFNSEVPWGGDPHNPNDPYWVDFVPADKRFWDDGKYHAALQDFSIGVNYRIQHGPWTWRPYISYGVPASNYPFFAKAAIGKNLWTAPVGMSFNYVPYFSDWHVGGSLAYVFSEKPLGVNVDFWLADLSAGYLFKANLSVEVFLSLKYARSGLSLLSTEFINGDPVSAVYPDDYDTEKWWQHDRLVGNRNLNFGVGIDYFFSREWKVSGSAYQSVWTDESNEVDYAFTLGFTRFFGSY